MKLIDKFIENQENPVTAPPITLAFFGDSVTQGCFELYHTAERKFATEFRVNEGYHTKLRNMLEMCYPSVPVNMIHGGNSGGNTNQAVARLERDILSHHPDLTVVCFGLNDCCSGPDFLEKYKENLRTIFTELQKIDSEIIFMTPNLLAHESTWEERSEFLRQVYAGIAPHHDDLYLFIEGAKEVCKEMNVPVCDCMHKWDVLKKNKVNYIRLLSNFINHPTHDMHWMFAWSLFEMIHGM